MPDFAGGIKPGLAHEAVDAYERHDVIARRNEDVRLEGGDAIRGGRLVKNACTLSLPVHVPPKGTTSLGYGVVQAMSSVHWSRKAAMSPFMKSA